MFYKLISLIALLTPIVIIIGSAYALYVNLTGPKRFVKNRSTGTTTIVRDQPNYDKALNAGVGLFMGFVLLYFGYRVLQLIIP
jgi:hypothetical protein